MRSLALSVEKIRVPWLILVVLLVVLPTVGEAKISTELQAMLTADTVDVPRLYELCQQEITNPTDAASAYDIIINDAPEEKLSGRRRIYFEAIRETLTSHDEMIEFIGDLPERSRPLRSLLAAKFILKHRESVSEQEFRQVNLIIMRDLDDLVGRQDCSWFAALYGLVTNVYLASGRYSPSDPDGDFDILANCFCRASYSKEQTNLANIMRDLNRLKAARFVDRVFRGAGCPGSPEILANRRTLLLCVAAPPEGADLLADLLPELHDGPTYSMALLVCSIHEKFHDNLSFHQAVFRSFTQRYYMKESLQPSRWPNSKRIGGGMSDYLYRTWTHLTDIIAFRPHELADHAWMISYHTSLRLILEFATTHGRALQEPFLSAFTKRVYVQGSPAELKQMLEYVDLERLPVDLRQRVESKVNTKWISLMDKSFTIPEPTNRGDSHDRKRR